MFQILAAPALENEKGKRMKSYKAIHGDDLKMILNAEIYCLSMGLIFIWLMLPLETLPLSTVDELFAFQRALKNIAKHLKICVFRVSVSFTDKGKSLIVYLKDVS